MYYRVLLFLHILLVALLVGAIASLYVVWRQIKSHSSEDQTVLKEALLVISERVITASGAGAVLIGILMLMDSTLAFTSSGLFRAKVTLGLILVGLVHALHKHIRDYLSEGGGEATAVGSINRLVNMAAILAPIVVLFGVFSGH